MKMSKLAALGLAGILTLTGCSGLPFENVQTTDHTAESVTPTPEPESAEASEAESAASEAETAPSEKLSVLGTFEDPELSVTTMAAGSYHGEYLLEKVDGDSATLLDAEGSPVGPSFTDIESLTEGYFAFTADGAMGILASDGTELLAAEALSIEMLSHTERFALVTFEDGKRQIFDLTEGALVENTATESDSTEFEAAGSAILVKNGDDKKILSAAGETLKEDAADYSAVGDYFRVRTDEGTYKVFNDALDEVFESDYPVIHLRGTSVFSFYTGEKYGLMNGSGEKIVDAKYDTVSELSTGYVKVGTSDDSGYSYGILKEDGTVILEPSSALVIDTALDGYFVVQEEDGEHYSLIGPDGGVIYSGQELIPEDTLVITEAVEGTQLTSRVAVMSEGGFALELRSVSKEGINLISAADESGKRGAYELENGTQLLSCAYDEIIYANGNFYALLGTTWTIYQYL